MGWSFPTYPTTGLLSAIGATLGGAFNQITAAIQNWAGDVNAGGNRLLNTQGVAILAGDLPSVFYSVTGASWSGGVATVTIGSHHIVPNMQVVVALINPSGYAGTVQVTAVTGTSISYSVASNPGSYVTGGNVTVGAGAPVTGQLAVGATYALNVWNGSTWVLANAPGAWLSPTFANSWANQGAPFNTAQYRMQADGVTVALKGTVNGTSASAVIVFVLPSGFRPVNTCPFQSVCSSTGAAFQVLIDSSGNVKISTGTASISLEGIMFSTT